MERVRVTVNKAQQLWGNWWGDENRLPAEGPLQEYIRVGSLIGIYIVLDRLLMRASQLSFDQYEAPFIYGEFVTQLFGSWYGIALVLALSLFLVFWRRLLDQWEQLNFGTSIRWLMVAAAGALAWSYSTYDFNLFFNQAHLLDRSLLLLFVILIYWRPIFILPFLTLLLPMVWQFTLMIGFSWTMTYLLLRILVLFVAAFALYLLNKRFPVQEFILVLGCLYASHYWQPGWGKLSWEWIRSDEIFLILPASYSNNWLAHLDPDQILAIMRSFVPFNGLMKFFVMFVELGAFLFFAHRKLPILFLAGWVGMHLGILASTGINLWMWILVDITLLLLLLRKDGLGSFTRLSPAQILLSMVLVVGGRFWCKPVELSWYDMPFSYAYEARAVTTDGEEIELPLSFFAPYDYQMIMTGLSYLAPQPVLFISDVKAEAALARELMAIRSKDKFLEIEAKHGLGGQDAEAAADFDAVVRRFVQNWNQRLDKKTIFSAIAAPNIVMNYRRKLPEAGAVTLQEIRFYQLTALFYKDFYEEIRRIPIRTIPINH